MQLHPKKLEYIEQEAFRILGHFEEVEEEKQTARSIQGSLEHRMTLDLTDKLADKPLLEHTFSAGETISVQECYKGKCIRLSPDNYPEFKKFIWNIYNEKEIKAHISVDFVEETAIKWMTTTIRNKKAENSFSTYLINKMDDSIEELKIHFPVLNLDIESPIIIGNAKLEYFTKEYFDWLIEKHKTHGRPNTKDQYEELRGRYQGKVFATFVVRAERRRAREIAMEQCFLAIDILKICSETLDVPNARLGFDIDVRARESEKIELIITKPTQEAESFSVSTYGNPYHLVITKEEWSRMISRQLPILNHFVKKCSSDPSELEILILNSIMRFGDAMTTKILHQRVVELFTILESLLLPDKNSPILDSVCKYCSKLISKEPQHRKDIIRILKKMYDVRSELIHHGKMQQFDLHNLRTLQHIVLFLLCSLIEKTQNHTSKLSVLREIDDAILNAY